ncbi:hypothetical protein HYALB_00014023 [Hymenoscyphus albidus]|uniref:Uncharacterized protein n=1 Tax=Hymenoscyphus albidus TaxID=595503 RepID=A0A9N9M0M7_9HELO|nr:hypothetical protein HYALB_00014023 [Hymenoscyphus albidus]
MAPPPPTTSSATPPQPTSMSYQLENIINAATTRAEEARLVFSPIAALWDDYRQSEDVQKLPSRLRKPLSTLCTEITEVVNKHFESYIKGAPLRKHIQTPSFTPSSASHAAPDTQATPTSCRTYAAAASTPLPITPEQPLRKAGSPPQRSKAYNSPRPETRLFVRISNEHPARECHESRAHVTSEDQAAS